MQPKIYVNRNWPHPPLVYRSHILTVSLRKFKMSRYSVFSYETYKVTALNNYRDNNNIINIIHYISNVDNTSQQDFGTRKVYCVSNVTFHAESKNAIKIFPSPTVLYNGLFNYWFFGIFGIFISDFFYTWTNILNGFEQRVVTYNLPLSYL